MDFACIDICEAGIVVTKDSQVIDTSPAIAVSRENGVITGLQAASEQYQIPQFTYNRFWKDLNQKKLPNRNNHIRHNADLAYTHLKDIIKRIGPMDEVVVAVPSEYGESELSLLAGIFEALKIRISAVVDSNVASLSSWAPEGQYQVLKIYPHHVTICKLKVNSEVILEDVEVIESIGWHTFQQKLADYTANLFLQQTRFYPFHEATSEKILNDQIPKFMRQSVISNTFEASIVHDGVPYTARLNSSEIVALLQEPIEALYREIDNNRRHILISERLASIPGLNRLMVGYSILKNSTCESGISQNVGKIIDSTDTLYLIERLPIARSPITNKDLENHSTKSEVTHILFENQAFSLKNKPLKLQSTPTDKTRGSNESAEVLLLDGLATLKPNSMKVSLNNEFLTSNRTLEIGDSIVVYPNGNRYIAIKISDCDAI